MLCVASCHQVVTFVCVTFSCAGYTDARVRVPPNKHRSPKGQHDTELQHGGLSVDKTSQAPQVRSRLTAARENETGGSEPVGL